MKKILSLVFALILVMAFAGCSDKMGNISSFEEGDVDKIVITRAMGNPAYGAECKTVIDVDEINDFIEIFNSGHLGGTVSDEDIGIGSVSTYTAYKNDEIMQTFSFNVNDTKVIWFDDKWRDVVYPEGSSTPCALYEQSQGELNIVDYDGNDMDLIRYLDDTYVESELSEETIEWLKNYNSLTKEEQLTCSSAPDFGDAKPLG